MRILVVEDEKNLNKIIVKKLTAEGYSVDSCIDGLDAWDYISTAEYDTVILDIMLPGLDGIEILKRARQKKISTPILMLTARDTVEDKVSGLDQGADDYLTKPFAFEELMARLRVLTRKKAGNSTNVYSAGDLIVDCDKRSVKRGGKTISLSSREFSILEYFIMNKNIVLSRDKIQHHIWNYDYEGESNMIDVYVRYLRKKIDEGFDKKLIHTVRNVGYVLKEDE